MIDRNPFTRSFWRSPRPPHAFVLGKDRLVYVGPQDPSKKAVVGSAPALRVVSRALPEDAFTTGPGDVPVAGPAVAGALQRLLAELGVKIQAASLVVPDGFAKLLAVDVEDADRNHRETDEMIAWKFGRSFGEPAPPLRISWLSAGPGAQGARVLALAVPEPAAASWEAPFEKAGIRIGALQTGAFAVSGLSKPAASGGSFLVWADADTATALFYLDGTLRFARTRPVFGDPEGALHEIRLAAAYLRPGAGGEELSVPCAAGPAGTPVFEALAAFRRAQGFEEPQPLALPALVPGAVVAPPSAASDPAILMGLGALAGDR